MMETTKPLEETEMPPPTIPGTTYPERRADCVAHEERIDSIQAEIHKFGGYFKVMGGSITVACMICGWFGQAINSKLDNIQQLLGTHSVAMAQLDGRVKSCESDIAEIKARHKFQDEQNLMKRQGK